MKIYIASDHGGFQLKSGLLKELGHEYEFIDLGCESEDSVDYPDYVDKLIETFTPPEDIGILICGSGQGMAIRANRYLHIRAALCWNREIVHLAREHNNANVLCLPGRHLEIGQAVGIVKEFLQTPFAGGRHERRVNKLSKPID
ncbi:MAG: RpiB/LacA/LacB family sugar-phosphate isomerase [Bdellovibrionales bacterium]|nr:RpiB/LacA/LacB family sugar-phosphate isomerase [Bdellovibrionales bacterium]